MSNREREKSIARLQRELTTISRRGSARVRREDETLSSVDRGLLGYIQDNPGTRAVEIAAHFALNRSTVSRQLTALHAHGLIASPAADESSPTGRGVPIVLTPRGEELLRVAAASLNAVLRRRLATWTEEEIELFAQLLDRFNSTPDDAA